MFTVQTLETGCDGATERVVRYEVTLKEIRELFNPADYDIYEALSGNDYYVHSKTEEGFVEHTIMESMFFRTWMKSGSLELQIEVDSRKSELSSRLVQNDEVLCVYPYESFQFAVQRFDDKVNKGI